MFWSSKPVLSAKDARMLNEIADALKARLEGFDHEIEVLTSRCTALEREVERLRREPHQSLAQKLRGKDKT